MLTRLIRQTKDLLLIRRTSIASKVTKVLSVSPGQLSCFSSSSPASSFMSKHEIMLTASLSKTLTGKNPSCVASQQSMLIQNNGLQNSQLDERQCICLAGNVI